ncbi:Na(+)/H(+) antiporter subunit D [Corynebacterium kalinowskii]|uniref:Na(+)/H(+) antiporter subunit D n=1 Tax=Corynebacterium kalinowskii TaxID=2675216 RepID=A0A6B8VVS9_9CORY|nr:monovalent cation/H+ antiporter subunit D family protein [Corynebacterium kalinowskii]QGU03035.1 Na(+)/H(+) antiporter subunit D [Corynebacterium kalinowskii]
MILPLFLAFPLLAAAIAAVSPWRFLRIALMLGIPTAGLIGGIWLFQQGTIAHSIGLYVGGVAIPYVSDEFSAVMIIATSLVALFSLLFAVFAGETTSRFFPSLALMLLGGVYGALLTADLFNLFVMVEIMLLPSYALLAMTGGRSRLAAGRMFVLSNLLASTMLVMGVGVVYGVSGTVNFAALAGAADEGPVAIAMGIVVLALAIKAGVFPMHTWLPRTYPSTSSAVMGLFSGLHTKVAVYALFRIYIVIFDGSERWAAFIIAVMVVSMLVGGFAGLGESTIRRVLAYQMVNGMPFILVMLAFSTSGALTAGIFYAVHHMVTVGSLILTTGAIEETYGTGTLSKLSGIARRDPWTSTFWAAGAFSLVGFPPFSGMWGKVAIVMEAATFRSWVLIAAIVLASIGALLSLLRVWRRVFWGKPPTRYPSTLVVAPIKALPGGALLACSLLMFVFAGPLFDVCSAAATSLLDVPGYTSAILGADPIGVVQ